MKNCKLLLLFILLCLPSVPVFAFRCAPSTTKAEFARADAVFSGAVVAQESREAELQMNDDQKKSKVLITATQFKVVNFWKGDGNKTVFLIDYQFVGETDTRFRLRRSFPFEQNQNYLVYAYNFQNALQAPGRCTNTKLLNAANNDLKQLGKGDTPTKTAAKTLRETLTEFIDKWNN